MKIIGIIPVRYKSSRFSGKPSARYFKYFSDVVQRKFLTTEVRL